MDAVIFDLDGTIVDTEGVHARALDEVVRARGLRGRAEGYVGLTDFQALELIFEDHGMKADPAEMRALVDEKTALVVERLEADEILTYDGAIELVTACAEAAPVAICTASASHEAKRALAATGLLDVVSTLITCCDVRKNKPDPEGYRLAADRLGVEAGGRSPSRTPATASPPPEPRASSPSPSGTPAPRTTSPPPTESSTASRI